MCNRGKRTLLREARKTSGKDTSGRTAGTRVQYREPLEDVAFSDWSSQYPRRRSLYIERCYILIIIQQNDLA